MKRVLLLAFIWGWSFLFIKVAVRGLTPATVAFARVALGLVVLVVLLRQRRVTLPRDLVTWRRFAVMGVVGTAAPFVLLSWAQQYLTTALVSVVNATTPLFAALVVAFALGERLRRLQLVGLFLGFVGVALAAGVGGGDLAGSQLQGVLAGLAASACYGISFAYAARHLAGVTPLVATTGQLVTATVVTLPLAVATSVAENQFELTARAAVALVLLGAVGTGAAYILNYRNISTVGPTKASVVTYFVPVVAIALGLLFLDEPFHLRVIGGASILVLGMAMLQQRLGVLRRGRLLASARGFSGGA